MEWDVCDQAEKIPGSFEGTDTVSLMVFVEDTPESTQNTAKYGSFDDAYVPLPPTAHALLFD